MTAQPGTGPVAAGTGLEVVGLVAGYGKAVVLHGLDLTVRPGEVVGVAGPNGAGKTTLLRAISGVVSRSARTLSFDGRPLRRDPVRTCSAGIVHVPQGRQLFAELTVEENLRIGAYGRRVREVAGARDRVLRLLPGIEPMLGRRAGLLSGGQQQMVAIARGLIGRPALLLVDELSLGLSPAAVRSISAAAAQSCRELGASLLWVDQNLSVLGQHCDRVVLLKDGIAVGLELSSADPGVRSVYF